MRSRLTSLRGEGGFFFFLFWTDARQRVKSINRLVGLLSDRGPQQKVYIFFNALALLELILPELALV